MARTTDKVKITSKSIARATSDRPWDLANDLLYKLCKKHSKHENDQEIIAKVWLIGRSYAAAIERRKRLPNERFKGDHFYTRKVVPKIRNSEIDIWLSSLKSIRNINENNIDTILNVHFQVMKLFKNISKLEKRSLASKYLHFHFPHLFFIYDSRAARTLRKLPEIKGQTYISSRTKADEEYRKFVEKCLLLRQHTKQRHSHLLSPRQLDNLLIDIANRK